jgi:hypothetical protein
MAETENHYWRLEERGSETQTCRVSTLPLDPYKGGLSSVRLAQRNWKIAAGLSFISAGVASLWLPPLGAVFAVLGIFFGWRSNQEDIELARVLAVYRGLVEAGMCFGELRWDGQASWVESDLDSSRRFADSIRELYGPIQSPSHLVLETDGHVWPVPTRLSEGDMPVEFSHIWARQVGPCEVLDTSTTRGADVLKKAREAGGGMEIAMVEIGGVSP